MPRSGQPWTDRDQSTRNAWLLAFAAAAALVGLVCLWMLE
jgi:hypothetical protein